MSTPVHGDPNIDVNGEELVVSIESCNNAKFWQNIGYDLSKRLMRAAGLLFINAIFHTFTMTEKKRGGSTGGNKRAKKRNRKDPSR